MCVCVCGSVCVCLGICPEYACLRGLSWALSRMSEWSHLSWERRVEIECPSQIGEGRAFYYRREGGGEKKVCWWAFKERLLSPDNGTSIGVWSTTTLIHSLTQRRPGHVRWEPHELWGDQIEPLVERQMFLGFRWQSWMEDWTQRGGQMAVGENDTGNLRDATRAECFRDHLAATSELTKVPLQT